MHARLFVVLAAVCGAVAPAARGVAQTATRPGAPPRAIRRDIPLTNMIRRAFAAGTRDSTGRPGRNYWQLWMDYTIRARLDPATGMLTGHETAMVHNTSDSAMTSIQLRLDQNIFAANEPRAEMVPEITDGMLVSRLTVNGDSVDLNPPRVRGFRGGPAPQVRLAAYGITQTAARITLPTPVAAHDSARLEVDWSFRVPAAEGERGMRMGRWADSLYQVAQWYPRVAVFDDLRDGGWDTDPYLGASEFYNNFGRFDVTLDVPAGWIVGATGVLQNPEDVLTPTTRERLSHVLESDSVRSIVSAGERGPGRSTAAGRPTAVALRRRHGGRLRVGDVQPVRVGRHPCHHPRWRAGPGQRPVPPGSRPGVRPGGADRAPRARVLLAPLDAVRLPAAHHRGRSGRRHGIPDVHHVGGRRGGPRDRPRVVADDGRARTRPGTASWMRASTST